MDKALSDSMKGNRGTQPDSYINDRTATMVAQVDSVATEKYDQEEERKGAEDDLGEHKVVGD